MTVQSPQPNKAHILIVEDDQGIRQMLLKKSRYSVGRSQQCDVQIRSPFVSRHHATIVRQFDKQGHIYYEIIDGDGRKPSANGILVNGEKVLQKYLHSGDKIVFGPKISIQYQHCHQDNSYNMPPDDPFDITLIDPAMIGNDLEE